MLLLGAVAAIGGITSLPFSWWRTFRIEERFGFNHTTLRVWVADIAKGLAVGVVLGLPLAVLVLWMMRGAGANWWLWVWFAWMAFQLLLLVLYPTVIAPLFNRFSPLPPGDARDRIERLLARCDFRAAGLFVIDGSKRSGHGNAYFAGFGPPSASSSSIRCWRACRRRRSRRCWLTSSGISACATSSSASRGRRPCRSSCSGCSRG